MKIQGVFLFGTFISASAIVNHHRIDLGLQVRDIKIRDSISRQRGVVAQLHPFPIGKGYGEIDHTVNQRRVRGEEKLHGLARAHGGVW